MKIKECFDIFIQMEYDAAKLYKTIANNKSHDNSEEDKVIAKVALDLSKEELKHVHILEELKKVDKISQIKTSDELNYISQQQNVQQQQFNSRRDFFTFALQCEKDTIILYNEIMLELTEHEEASKAFQTLINEERKHMHSILNILLK